MILDPRSFRSSFKQLGQRAFAWRHPSQCRLDFDYGITNLIVNRFIASLDGESAAFRGDHHSTGAQGRDQLLAIAINFDKNRFRFLGEMFDFARVHQVSTLQHDDAIAGAFDIGHQV